jgi:transcription antitermination factor NusB
MGDGGAAASGRKGPGRARHLSRPKRDDTDDPRRSRERALKVLFQAELRGRSPDEVLAAVAGDEVARAMLDEIDDLAGDATPSAPDAPGEGVGGPSAADASETDDGEPEAARIWREERERAEARLAGASDADAPDPAPTAEDRVEAAAVAPPIDGFTRALVLGVQEHRAEIDELIVRYARRWAIHRMPVVDRTVLRLATYELLHQPTAPPVVINEAVDLAKGYSTDDSGRYVNGVLESIRKELAARALATPGEDQPAAVGEPEPSQEG